MGSKDEVLVRKIKGVLQNSFLAFLAIAIAWVFAVRISNTGWINLRSYSILGAPFFEEALKGLLVFLLAPTVYLLYLSRAKHKPSLTALALLAGVLVGLLFGLVESTSQKESIEDLLTGILTHSIWTAAVGVGTCSFWRDGSKRLPIGTYLVAVFGHMAWNYQVYFPSPLTTSIAAVFLTAAVPVSLLGYSVHASRKKRRPL